MELKDPFLLERFYYYVAHNVVFLLESLLGGMGT